MNPLFWLGISILLVTISLVALLTVAILVLQELARAARSAEKLLDTLNRELPATLQDLRLTGKELSDLSEEVSGSMQSARNVAQQVDQGLLEAKAQAQKAQITTRSLVAGATAAFRVLVKPTRRRRRPPTPPKSRQALQSLAESQRNASISASKSRLEDVSHTPSSAPIKSLDPSPRSPARSQSTQAPAATQAQADSVQTNSPLTSD